MKRVLAFLILASAVFADGNGVTGRITDSVGNTLEVSRAQTSVRLSLSGQNGSGALSLDAPRAEELANGLKGWLSQRYQIAAGAEKKQFFDFRSSQGSCAVFASPGSVALVVIGGTDSGAFLLEKQTVDEVEQALRRALPRDAAADAIWPTHQVPVWLNGEEVQTVWKNGRPFVRRDRTRHLLHIRSGPDEIDLIDTLANQGWLVTAGASGIIEAKKPLQVQGMVPGQTPSYSPASTFSSSPSTSSWGRATTSSGGGGPVYVRSYYRKDGTYVRAHTRSR